MRVCKEVAAMEERQQQPEERHLMKIEESIPETLTLGESQQAEQLYNSAGLDPVVNAGLHDYDERIQKENKLINKVFGTRGSDLKGYGEAVAKRVAYAVYNLMNKQYGGKMGNLQSYIMTLEDERNRANDRYDELMGRVVGILGDEYKELRTDSTKFMEKLTNVLGEDIKESKIDQAALAERLADIDGLRSQVKALNKEIENTKSQYETQLSELRDTSNRTQEELAQKISDLESNNTTLSGELRLLKEKNDNVKNQICSLPDIVFSNEIGESQKEKLYSFLLEDTKVPHMVIDGVRKFIDLPRYLGIAAEKGAEAAINITQEILSKEMP
jgi:hypothetical protein